MGCGVEIYLPLLSYTVKISGKCHFCLGRGAEERAGHLPFDPMGDWFGSESPGEWDVTLLEELTSFHFLPLYNG